MLNQQTLDNFSNLINYPKLITMDQIYGVEKLMGLYSADDDDITIRQAATALLAVDDPALLDDPAVSIDQVKKVLEDRYLGR